MLMEVVSVGYVVRDACQLRDRGVVFAETKLFLRKEFMSVGERFQSIRYYALE